MWIRGVAFVLSLVGLTVAPVAAMAACAQGDLTGNWQVYSAGWNGQAAYWVRCRIAINSAGMIARTTCVNSAGRISAVTGGRVVMGNAAACTFTGQLTVGGSLNRIGHGTMADDKMTGNGVGTFPGGSFLFSVTKI